MKDGRAAAVHWFQWLQERRRFCTYSEGSQRMSGLNRRGLVPFVGDCSATFRDMYRWANLPDPMGEGYGDLEGYTGTLISNAEHRDALNRHGIVTLRDGLRVADAAMFGPGTGWHVAMVVALGPDPLCLSMGRQGDPNYVRVSACAIGVGEAFGAGPAEVRYLSFDTMTRKPVGPPRVQK